jgi:hypothetical protein
MERSVLSSQRSIQNKSSSYRPVTCNFGCRVCEALWRKRLFVSCARHTPRYTNSTVLLGVLSLLLDRSEIFVYLDEFHQKEELLFSALDKFGPKFVHDKASNNASKAN